MTTYRKTIEHKAIIRKSSAGVAALKERLAKRTREEMELEWADPKFREDYAAWEREYRATVALYQARQKANLTFNP